MKTPCKECLIQVTCSEECDDFRNFMTLIKNAMKNFSGHYNNPQYKIYQKLNSEANYFSHQIFIKGLEKAVDDAFN